MYTLILINFKKVKEAAFTYVVSWTAYILIIKDQGN